MTEQQKELYTRQFRTTQNNIIQYQYTPIDFTTTNNSRNPTNSYHSHQQFYIANENINQSLSEIDHLTIATHNVNSLNNVVKQQSLLQALVYKSISICGITNTHLSENSSRYLLKKGEIC